MGGDASRPLQEDYFDICVYHERQKGSLSGAESGLHAINNLLQRCAVTHRDLDKTTKSLDKADPIGEQNLVRSPRKSASYQYWPSVGKKSTRTDKDASKSRNGNFSIQTLQKALKPFDVCLLATSDAQLRGPEAARAWGYVSLCGGHWSVMRQVGEHSLWMDLDPTLIKPQLMSAAEVLRLQIGMPPKSGGLVFAVVGTLPPNSEKKDRRVVRLNVDPRSVCTTHFNL